MVWYINFRGIKSKSLRPYTEHMRTTIDCAAQRLSMKSITISKLQDEHQSVILKTVMTLMSMFNIVLGIHHDSILMCLDRVVTGFMYNIPTVYEKE